jgi:hypothetical protein
MLCDRHGQNVFIDEQGSLTLIDLDQAFRDVWRVWGADSLSLDWNVSLMLDRLRRVNSTQVVLAAIWDLLTMQCDRHGQNVFVDEQGGLTLIDLDQAFGDGWRVCGVDSLFLPTTQKYMINLLGYWYVMKWSARPPRSTVSPQVSLDYRCHAEGGAIGRNYPPRVKQCLQAIGSMEPVQVSSGRSKIVLADLAFVDIPLMVKLHMYACAKGQRQCRTRREGLNLRSSGS